MGRSECGHLRQATKKDQPDRQTQDSRLMFLRMLRMEELEQKLAEEKPDQ